MEQLLSMFFIMKKKIYPARVSKYNSIREKQVIILIISNGEGQHYLPIKKLSAILRGTTSKHHGNFYCLNYLNSLAKKTKNKHESHKRVCENKYFCNIIMPSEGTKVLIDIKNLIMHHLSFMQILNV